MGRQDDLDRMRQLHRVPDQNATPIADTQPTSKPIQPAAPHRIPSKKKTRFTTWMLLLISVALLVILTHRSPLVWDPRMILTSASEIDQSEAHPGDHILNLVVTQGWNHNHMGVDVALPNGQDSTGIPVYAIGNPGAAVKVTCWFDPIGGNNVSTYSDGQEFAFDYAHLDSSVCAPRGTATVTAGDPIGEIGNTGAGTTGPHLHFQQRKHGTENPVTGEHVPGWKGFIEQALEPKASVENGEVTEPEVLITPSDEPLQSPDLSPQSPQSPDNFQEQPGFNSPIAPPANPDQAPSPSVRRSPNVYPPI